MKRKLFLIALLGCLTFSQALSIPVYAAAVTNPTEAGGNDGAGGGGGYTGGKAGTYVPAKYQQKTRYLTDTHPDWNNTYPYVSLSGTGSYWYTTTNDGFHYQVGASAGGTVTINGENWTLSENLFLNVTDANASNKTVKVHITNNGIGNAYITPSQSFGWDGNGISKNIYQKYNAKVSDEKAEKSAGGTNDYYKQNILTSHPIINGTEKDATGNGIVELTAINANVASGQENTSYINNIKMTDKVSPDEIILSYLQKANKTTVNWGKPDSNGTEYEFKVQVYRVDYTADNGLVLEQDSEFM